MDGSRYSDNVHLAAVHRAVAGIGANTIPIVSVVLVASLKYEIDLTKDNAIGYRRVIGIDPKNREAHNVKIEREFIEVMKEHRMSISDAVNMGLNLILHDRL